MPISVQKNKFHLNKRNMLQVDCGWKSLKTRSYQVPPEKYHEILIRQAEMQSLQKYKSVDKKISTITTTVLNRHMCYLTEELVPLSLFDEDLPLDQRTLLAARISQQTPGVIEIRKPNLPVITKESELPDFVGERSTVLFNLLNIPVTCLQNSDWHLRPEYSAIKKSIKDFSPLNDSCKRALGMATSFNSKIARTKEGFEELMQVVAAHRRKYLVKTKSDLQSFY